MMKIAIKNLDEISIMREAGRRLSFVMDEIGKIAKPAISTLQVDELAEELIRKSGGVPAFLGYGDKHNPFPATICASLNDQVVHGIPQKDIVLREGDIFKVDIGMEYQGFFVDMARTFPIGQVSPQAQRIIEVVEKSFWKGIKQIRNGSYLSQYSKAVQEEVEKNGFSVVRNLVGHGIGRQLHEAPQIPNYLEKRFVDLEFKTGMALALEPMINEGTHETVMSSDGWAFETADGKLSAHYENTVIVTDDGVEVLTAS